MAGPTSPTLPTPPTLPTFSISPKTTARKTSGNKPKKGAIRKPVKKLPKAKGDPTLAATTSQSSKPLEGSRAAKATATTGEKPSSSSAPDAPDDLGSEGEDPEPDQLNDPDKVFDDEDEDDEGDHTICRGIP